MIIRPTRAAGHATQLAQEAAVKGHKLVLAAGGDGTLGEVANGLAGTSTIMAPLPVGTANSFAKELLMPRPNLLNPERLLEASESLAGGKVYQMDLGYSRGIEGKGHYWLLWSGVGADSFLVDQLEPRPKWSKKMGTLGYTLQGLMVSPRLPKMKAKVTVDGRLFEDTYLLVLISNCRRYAGGILVLNPQARLDDGLFEVWMFRGAGVFKTLNYIWQVKWGRHHHHKDVTLVSGRQVTVYTEPSMPCQTDGDRSGKSPMMCEIKSGALRLLVPNTAPDGLFEKAGEKLA